MNKLLTIIIPHYNSKLKLEKLLSSIPSLKEIEVIIVDDKSEENLSDLKSNPRYTNVVFLQNTTSKKGAGACRNIGLENANGKWVLFADADDFFIEGFYSVVSKYFHTNNDVIFFIPTSVDYETGEITDRHKLYEQKILNYQRQKNIDNELALRYEFPVPWSKLINKSFLVNNNIFFEEIIASNDTMFSAKVGYYMKSFLVSSEIIYCVTKSKGSLINSINNEVFDSRLGARIRYSLFLKSKLSQQYYKKINTSGRGMIYNALVYRMGIMKVLSTYTRLRKNKIEIFDYRFLNPFFLFKKFIFYRKSYKHKKKYLIKK